MRIRKQQPRGNPGGEASNPGPDSQEQELVESATGVKEKPGDDAQMGVLDEGSGGVRGGIERVDSTSRSAFTWLDKLRYSKGITEIEPYSNLEDFITFLSKDGGSSSKGRLEEEQEVEESNSSLSKVQQLARYNSALSSELSSKQASGGGPQDGGTPSPALVSCDESSASLAQVQQHQLRSDASLPTAFRQSFSVADPSEPPPNSKKKGQFPRKGFAGTSSEIPIHPNVEEVLKKGDGSCSIAEPVDTPPPNDQIQAPLEVAAQQRSHRNKKIPSFTDTEDNPALQSRDSLEFSLYTVCNRAGKAGLTAREAMSEILERELPGVLEDQNAVQSSRRIAKLFRNSPYYMELGEGKFALCTAVIDTQLTLNISEHPVITSLPTLLDEPDPGQASLQRQASLQSEDVSQKRMQIGSEEASKEKEPEIEVKKPGRSGRPKKLKYMKQENKDELGNQCNRTDGKGWVCPLLAKPGYQLCDHHLDKLRCKPGSRSKKKKTSNNKQQQDDNEQVGTAATTTTSTATATTTTTSTLVTTSTSTEPHLDTAGHEFHAML